MSRREDGNMVRTASGCLESCRIPTTSLIFSAFCPLNLIILIRLGPDWVTEALQGKYSPFPGGPHQRVAKDEEPHYFPRRRALLDFIRDNHMLLDKYRLAALTKSEIQRQWANRR